MTTEKAALWQQAFGDSTEFINGFFRTGFSPDRCRALEKNGTLAAVLYWFDCQWEDKKVAYLYAVATDKAFRGQGLCRQLMSQTHRELREAGYAGAALVPAEEGLFQMYEKLGYRRFCPMTPKSVLSGGAPVDVNVITPEEYSALLPGSGIVPGAEMLHFYATYGRFYAYAGGCFCAAREDDTLYMQEFWGDPAVLPGIGSALGAETVQVRLPGGETPFAMYYSFTEDAMPEYFGFALD